MTHHPSRKHFLAKLAGGAAIAAVLPKALASSAPVVANGKTSPAPAAPVVIRTDPRAVARRAESI